MKSVAQVLYRRLRATSALVSFSPASLFASGEQGVWLDNSDFTTLFQDAAGTTPVTGYEQFVGLRLDKSKGLVLGNQLFTNADFDNSTTGWTASGGSTFTVSGGRANWSAASGSVFFFQNVSAAANKFYEMTVNVVSVTGTVRLVVNGGLGATSPPLTAGITTVRLQNSSANGNAGLQADTAFSIVVESISIRELPGNHAYQTNINARAVLSARYNLLTQTENFGDAYWSKQNFSINPNGASDKTTAPNGTVTADKVVLASGTAAKAIWRDGISAPCVLTCHIKIDTGVRYIQLLQNGAVATYANFDVTGELTGTRGANVSSSSIVNLGNGWYRLTAVCGGSGTGLWVYAVDSASAGYSPPTSATGTFYIWGADLRVANESSALPAYQRVGAAVSGTSTSIGTPDYDTVGFPAYLRYDGGDWYQTGSINFTATDKMSVFSGVRKFNAAGSFAIFAELSSAAYLNPGSFAIAAPGGLVGNTDNFGFTLVGSGTAGYDAVSYPPPFTAILAVQYNIGAASPSEEVVPRINAVLNQTGGAGTTAGTGTFGNYPLYIGARNAGASLPFTGREYETIVLGRAVTATELTNTEGYMETQTFGKDMSYVYSDELTTATGDLITAADGDQIYMTVTYQ